MQRKDAGIRLLRQHRLGFLAALAVVALGLGFYGYLQTHVSVVEAAYNTLSLLALNFRYEGAPAEMPIALQLARFIVPAVAAFATFTALIVILEDEWHLLRARRQRRHVVVCGLGGRGIQLVRSLRQDPKAPSVVALESDRANANIAIARDLGAIVLVGDATEEDVLHAARVRRAATLISLLSDNVQNAAVANVARRLCEGSPNRLRAFCHVADMDLVGELTSAATDVATESFELEWFSVPERAARILISDHVELAPRSQADDPPHIALVGTDDLSRAIVVNAARQWRALGAKGRVKVTVMDRDAKNWAGKLADRYPAVRQAAELQALEEDLRAPADGDLAPAQLSQATAVFICAPTDSDGLELGFAAAHILDDARPIVVRLLIGNAPFAELLNASGREGSLRLFSLVDETCSYESITHGLHETVAIALHDVYRGRQLQTGGEANGPNAPWAELDERYVHSNREQAAHVWAKLQAVDCRIRPLRVASSPPLEFQPEEVERLAELEHDRWSAERRGRGWVYGKPTNRDASPPVSEWLVEWRKLPEAEREKDREFVRQLPVVLAVAGYEVYRSA